MDANAYRLNKILGLVLGSALVLQVLHLIDENFTPTRIVAKPASEPAGKPTGDATAAAQSFDRALASASAERQCSSVSRSTRRTPQDGPANVNSDVVS